jgi:hypothetical protein
MEIKSTVFLQNLKRAGIYFKGGGIDRIMAVQSAARESPTLDKMYKSATQRKPNSSNTIGLKINSINPDTH